MNTEELPMTEYPFIVEYVAPGIFTFRAVANCKRRDVEDCAAAIVKRTGLCCAIAFAADDYVRISPDGKRDTFYDLPFDGMGFREDAVDPAYLPLGARRPKPQGIEIHRDLDGRTIWTGAYNSRSGRGRIYRYELDKTGKQTKQKEYDGDARGFYLYALDLGANVDELKQNVGLGLPDPWAIYDDERDKLLRRGRCFSAELCGAYVKYSVWRNQRGWWFVITWDGAGENPLDGAIHEECGPFKTKAELCAALKEYGLNSEVDFR